jgi:hypothetical protein
VFPIGRLRLSDEVAEAGRGDGCGAASRDVPHEFAAAAIWRAWDVGHAALLRAMLSPRHHLEQETEEFLTAQAASA